MLKNKKLTTINEEDNIKYYNHLVAECKKRGFIQYEISNFAKKGYESKHNLNYWNSGWYLGVGPSAHSFNAKSRQWNISKNSEYIVLNNKNKPFFEKEILERNQIVNEFIFLSLRTISGINKEKIKTLLSSFDLFNQFKKNITRWISLGCIIEKEDRYILSDKGKIKADYIASDLFFV